MVWVDVRTPAEFEDANIEGSILQPLSDLDPATVRDLADGKPGCLVICQSGVRSKQAAEKLKAAGIEGVHILEGGVGAWDAAGLPLRRGKRMISLERQVRIGAGSLVVVGVILGLLVHPGFLALSAFVGGGLIFAGITDWCGMGLLLARMPWNQR